MQLTTIIIGSVTLNRLSTQVLKGLQIEVFDSNASVGWLGGTKIKANGQFKFIINRQTPTTPATNYTFKIYKNGQLLHTDTFAKNLSTYGIDISLQDYEAFVTPAISVTEQIDYFVVKGQLLSTLLKPLAGDIILYEKVYKNKTQLMVTTSGADGYFEIKINSRFFVNTATNCKRILFLEAEIGGTVICTSSFFQDFTSDLFIELVSINPEVKPVNLFTRIEEAVNAATNTDSTLGTIVPFSVAFDEMASYLTSVTCFELSLIRVWLLAKIYSTQKNISAKFIFALFVHITTENINEVLLLDAPAQQSAIDTAVQLSTIIWTGTEMEVFHTAVLGFKKTYFLNQRIKGETSTYGGLYAIVFSDNPAHQDVFLNTYFSTQGTKTDFWDKLAESWEDSTVATYKRRLSMMSWVGCQTDIFSKVIRVYDDAPEQMAVKSVWDWEDFIDLVAGETGNECIPNVILNNDAIDDKKKYYATKLFEICNLHYPMRGYSGLVTRNASIYGDTLANNLLTFIVDNPAYSFRNNSSSLTEDLSFGDMTDEEISDIKNELLCLERLANICNSNTKAIAAMRIMKIRSASDITGMTSEAFIDALQSAYDQLDPPPTTGQRGSATIHNLPAHDAGQMYAQAGAVVGLSTLGGVHMSLDPVGATYSHTTFPWAEPVFNPADPTLSTMFGDINTCCCEHCRSVYSPTAYFTDTLRFLQEYSSTSNPSTQLYEELMRRRTDLKHIDLTCKNANTPIPYVDLVNEILESKIIQLFPTDLLDTGESEPLSFQTEGESTDLLSYPEHKTKIPLPNGEYIDYTSFRNVYDSKLNKPAESFYPWILPFNLAIEESRVYLKHLGYSRYDAMQLFRPVDSFGASNNTDISPLNREIEFHNLIPETVDIISNSLSVQLHEYYGILGATFDIVDPYDTSALIQFTSVGYKGQFNENLHILIQQLKISYTQLLQLLTTEHLNPIPGVANPGTQRPISIVAKTGKPDDTCIITELELKFNNPTWEAIFYDRLHRHVRLHKLTGWSIYDIDKAIRYVSLAAGDSITSSNVIKILKLFRWSKELGFSIDEIQSGWNDLDIYDKYRDYDCKGEHYIPPVYDILFKNKAVINPTDINFVDPNNLSTPYIDSKATIMAAFKIDDTEFQEMILTLGLSTPMTLTGLAHLHILAKLCNYYKITFSQFKAILQLYNISINIIFSIDNFEMVVQKMNVYKSLKLDVGYVQHLMSSPIADDDFVFTTEKATTFYSSLQNNLKATFKLYQVDSVAELDALASSDFNLLQDDCRATLIAEFGKEFNSIELDTLQNLCNEKILINAIDSVVLPIAPSLVSKESLQFFLSYEGDFTDFASTINTTTGIVSTTQPIMYTNSLLKTLQFLKRLVDLFASLKINTELYTALDIKVGAPLVSEFGFASLYDTWLDSTTNTPSQLPELVNFIQWIIWRDRNGISNSELATFISWLMNGTINPDFPANYADNVINLLQADSSLVELFLVTATNAVSTTNILKASGTPLPSEYYLASTLQRIADINIQSQKVALNILDVFETLLPSVQLSDSEKIRNTAKAKYEAKNWLAVAQPLQNALREKQREALVAFLIAHASSFIPPFIQPGSRKWRNENDLYAFLLIDVEMKPFALTSRIKQGICSLQLYIDRVLMNLERQDGIPSSPALELIDERAVQWKKWRKWYRIWEANRKIFLYPENWIEPELRLDKTPLFEKLENTLMQDEVTDAHVESAIEEYLEQLDEIGRLEPVTMIDIARPITGQEKTYISETYYFARTQAEPHKYYYRTFKNKKYTPWQAVDIDIKGEHITAYYDPASDKVYLLWLNFIENPNVPNKWSDMSRRQWFSSMRSYFELPVYIDDQENKEYLKGLDIRLHWSELKNSKWLPSKVSKEYITLSPYNIYDLINHLESNSNQDANNINRFNLLTNNKSTKLINFFKSRLYVNAIKGDGDSMRIVLLFPFSLKEISRYLHGFYFPDMFSDPVVMKDTYIVTRTNAQPNTNLANQKFINSKIDNNGGAFKRAWSDNDNNTGQFIYINLYDAQPSNEIITVDNQPINVSNDMILKDTPKGVYNLRYHAAFNHFLPLDWSSSFYFYDDENTFLVSPKYYLDEDQNKFGIQITSSGATSTNTLNVDQLVDYFYGAGSVLDWTTSNVKYGFFFQTFYHPHVKQYRKTLYMGGISALLGQGIHQMSNPAATYPITNAPADKIQFSATYQPTSLTLPVYPLGVTDFSYTGAYSQYNWEIFFHAPLLIANRLKENQRFEEAQKWYHYIFDPTTSRDMDGIVSISKNRFWKFRPFFDESTNTIVTVQDMMNNLADYQSQIEEWEEHPFEPHVIARIRILAYMKNVVMKYLDNLIAWADNLFSRDTIESINEATNLYVLALNIMGEKPQDIPPRAISNYYTFDELLGQITTANPFDGFSNIYVGIESFIGPNVSNNPSAFGGTNAPKMLYFCIPRNERLMGYWKIIADRLFKIRNSMNIEGIQRQMPLYEPEIDPALLVKAAAAGLSMETVMNEISSAGATHYRFAYMLQKANELCNDVKSLGNSLLSALEKKDAEKLSLLRSSQELNLLEQVRSIKELQLKDAETTLESLLKTKEITLLKQNYYQRNSAEYMNSKEKQSQKQFNHSVHLQEVSQGVHAVGSIMSAVPNIHLQGLSSGTSITLAAPVQAAAEVIGLLGYISSSNSSMNATTGGYDRRKSDWDFQVETSKIELEQIEKNIISTRIKIQIAQKELENHETQIENSSTVYEYMKSKFTNEQLYNWMIGQISATYFQSYKLCYDLARKAERTFTKELPLASIPETGIIQYGYWDSLKKGLLAGDRLQLDLRRLDLAYIENNKREFELTKHISLASIFPASLFDLQQTGVCSFDLVEELFSLDFPSHFLRRIKSVSISIPCIAGPYTTIPATLTLSKSSIRKEANTTATLVEDESKERIATSSSQNDSGVFELNFRDERYVPFEGRGAISSWDLSLMDDAALRLFDYNTISDVIIHLKYSAHNGEEQNSGFGGDVKTALKANLSDAALHLPFAQLVNLKTQFANEWTAFVNDIDPNKKFTFLLTQDMFPFFCIGKTIDIKSIVFHVQGLSDADELTMAGNTGLVFAASADTVMNSDNNNNYTTNSIAVSPSSFPVTGLPIQISLTSTGTSPIPLAELIARISELNLALSYTVS